MIFINEWLPNPSSSDVEGEWIELFNDGPALVDLTRWVLVTKGGKEFFLNGKAIGAGEYLLLPRTETKLTLHNTDGALALYDASGKLVDESRFLGTAPEGKSFSRFARHSSSGGGSDGGSEFVFVEPTPGAKNIVADNLATNHLALIAKNYPLGEPLNPSLGAPEILGITFGGAAVLAILVLIVFKKNENLSNLFFKRNQEVR